MPQMLEDNKPSWMRSIKLSHVRRVRWAQGCLGVKVQGRRAAQPLCRSCTQRTRPAARRRAAGHFLPAITCLQRSLGPVSPEPTAVKVYSEGESRSDEVRHPGYPATVQVGSSNCLPRL